jgi:hypothetical protein
VKTNGLRLVDIERLLGDREVVHRAHRPKEPAPGTPAVRDTLRWACGCTALEEDAEAGDGRIVDFHACREAHRVLVSGS